MHAWLARYEREGMEGMGDGSHRPIRCPHQMAALVEVRLLGGNECYGHQEDG